MEPKDDSIVAATAAAAAYSKSGVIRFEVDKEYDGRWSPEFEVGGVPWRAYGKKRGNDLEVGLCCMLSPLLFSLARCFVDAEEEYTLINSDITKNITEKCSGFCNNDVCAGGIFYKDWNDLMDEEKGFIKEGKMTIEIRTSITKMKGVRLVPRVDFTDPNEPCHDVTLVIEGEKIYASKQYLSLHSPVFNAMFYGDFTEKNQKEIELKDVNREEFIEMLNALYPSCRRLTKDNIEPILKLGDRFQVKFVMDLSTECLGYPCFFSDYERLRIAEPYGLKMRQAYHVPDNLRVRAVALDKMVETVAPNEDVDFTDPDEPRHDATLVINGEKVYVSRQFLALHSPVFHSLFYGDSAEKNKKEFELKDVDREEFLEMLHVLYPSDWEITPASALYLIKLGDRFKITSVIYQAEWTLSSEEPPNGLSIVELLRMADQYKLYGLWETCIYTWLKTIEDFRKIKRSPIYPSLSDETKDAFCDRLLERATINR